MGDFSKDPTPPLTESSLRAENYRLNERVDRLTRRLLHLSRAKQDAIEECCKLQAKLDAITNHRLEVEEWLARR